MSHPFTFFISPSAQKRIVALMTKDPTKKGMRVVIDAGGCHGFQYHFKLDDVLNEEEDIVIEEKGAVVIIDKTSCDFLEGSTIDYKEELIGAYFTLVNPNATSSCGCGSSFSI